MFQASKCSTCGKNTKSKGLSKCQCKVADSNDGKVQCPSCPARVTKNYLTAHRKTIKCTRNSLNFGVLRDSFGVVRMSLLGDITLASLIIGS